jgi:hypothetical protein
VLPLFLVLPICLGTPGYESGARDLWSEVPAEVQAICCVTRPGEYLSLSSASDRWLSLLFLSPRALVIRRVMVWCPAFCKERLKVVIYLLPATFFLHSRCEYGCTPGFESTAFAATELVHILILEKHLSSLWATPPNAWTLMVSGSRRAESLWLDLLSGPEELDSGAGLKWTPWRGAESGP